MRSKAIIFFLPYIKFLLGVIHREDPIGVQAFLLNLEAFHEQIISRLRKLESPVRHGSHKPSMHYFIDEPITVIHFYAGVLDIKCNRVYYLRNFISTEPLSSSYRQALPTKVIPNGQHPRPTAFIAMVENKINASTRV